MVRKVGLVIGAVCLGIICSTAQVANTNSDYDPSRFNTGVFDGCPPEGLGGDPDLNLLKNRDKPPDRYQFKPISELCQFSSELASQMNAKKRRNWTVGARAEIVRTEQLGVVTEGYLIACVEQGVEACNCRDITNHDYHLWLGLTSQAVKSESMIAEVSPRTLRLHPSWDLKVLKRLAKQRALVRLSGWAMWDGEHGANVGKSRATLLEIHPIHKIEVRSGDKWVEL